MATPERETSVRAQIVVDVPIEHAFAVFTHDASWKPPEHNLLEVEIAESVFEAHEGGYVYDRGLDGSECRWARVLAYQPPRRIVLSWLVTRQWRVDSAVTRTSEVEVQFIAETRRRTRVELEHRHLDRHGEGWEALRDAVAAPDGWPLHLRRLAERLAA